MNYRSINSDSIIKKITSRDNLFFGKYCIDTYQNCEFGCKYCDSSYEKTVYILTNADKMLEKKIKKLEKGLIIIGYVNDPYQKIEEKYEITKKILKIIKKYNYPCHIQTKSDLILRDINILSDIPCRVTISIISINKNNSQIFEKNVPSFEKRLNIVKILLKNKIKTGVALIPVLPFLIDYELEEIVKNVKDAKAEYLLHKSLELKGHQKDMFIEIIKKYYPNLLTKYEGIYKNDFKPNEEYIDNLDYKMKNLCMKYNISQKITK